MDDPQNTFEGLFKLFGCVQSTKANDVATQFSTQVETDLPSVEQQTKDYHVTASGDVGQEGQEEPVGDDPARRHDEGCALGADLTMVLQSSPADRELYAVHCQLRLAQTGAVADGCQESIVD
ncbi:hypothetical protein ABBQ32_004042 [Trebouxia sp. C0010 RCD-2024]